MTEKAVAPSPTDDLLKDLGGVPEKPKAEEAPKPAAAPEPETKPEPVPEKPEKSEPAPGTKPETKPEEAPKPAAKKPETPKPAAKKPEAPKPDQTWAQRIKESREVLKHPLPAGQKFFESPEGYVMIGEADKPHMWCRYMNGGKGGWINPKR